MERDGCKDGAAGAGAGVGIVTGACLGCTGAGGGGVGGIGWGGAGGGGATDFTLSTAPPMSSRSFSSRWSIMSGGNIDGSSLAPMANLPRASWAILVIIRFDLFIRLRFSCGDMVYEACISR